MHILADENCDRDLVAQLRAAGHDVEHVSEILRGEGDVSLFDRAARDRRILLTNDLDFGMLAERSTTRPPGIVLLRLHPLRARARTVLALEFFAQLGSDWEGRFFVVEPGLIRQRSMIP